MAKSADGVIQFSVYGTEPHLRLRDMSKWAREANDVRALANQLSNFDERARTRVARREVVAFGEDLYTEFPTVNGFRYDPLMDDLMISIRQAAEYIAKSQPKMEEFANALEAIRSKNLSAGKAQWSARHAFATVTTIQAPSGVSIPIYINGFPMYPPQPMATWYTATIYGGPSHGTILLNDYVTGPNRVHQWLNDVGFRAVPGMSNLYWR
jgi:hypothetical protein